MFNILSIQVRQLLQLSIVGVNKSADESRHCFGCEGDCMGTCLGMCADDCGGSCDGACDNACAGECTYN